MSAGKQPSKTDLMYEIVYNPRFVPVTSPNVSVKTVMEGGEPRHLMRNHKTGQHYELDDATKVIWELCDGSRTQQQITEEALSSGKIPKKDVIVETLLFFADSDALKAEEEPAKWRRIRVVSSFETQVILIKDGSKILGRVHSLLRPILRSSFFWLSMILILIGIVVFAPRFNSIFNDAANFNILGSTVVGFLFYNFIVLAPVIAIHELAHGLALVRYSGRAGEIGTGMFYFGPMFFVDASAYWSLPRRQRIMIMWAGSLTTLLIAVMLVFARALFEFPFAVERTMEMAAFWCFYTTLWNLAPPFETDGYYLLADLVNMPNLRPDAFSYLKTRVLRLLGRSVPEPDDLTDRKRRILLGYAVFALVFTAYIIYQTLRFTSYMAVDAASWSLQIGQSLLVGQSLTALAYFVGIASVAYFLLTISGYGVLALKQIRGILVRGLRFEALHDRDLSVFLYLPSQISSLWRSFEAKIASVSRGLTSNFSLGRTGPLFHATLRIGSTSVPLSEIKLHLRKIEDKFYRLYQNLLASNIQPVTRQVASSLHQSRSLHSLLSEMAEKASHSVRHEVKAALREFSLQQERMVRYVWSSTFATVWTIEIPPAQQYDMLENVLPELLVEDLTMTNLVDEIEDFKKRTVYGLSTIAELSQKSTRTLQEAVASPEKFQVIAYLEPVRGRIILVGRTERLEKDITELGSLIVIQVWSGFLDSLLEEVNLNLYSIVQSMPLVPDDLTSLPDGEVNILHRYLRSIEQYESQVNEGLTIHYEAVRPSKAKLSELRKLFQPESKAKVGLLDSILSLNSENLKSIPASTKEARTLSKNCFGWAKAFREALDDEQRRRKGPYQARTRKFLRSYWLVAPVSAILAGAGLIQPNPSLLLTLLGIAASANALWFAAYYFLRRSAETVPRYPSTVFTQTATSLFAMGQMFEKLLIGMRLLVPSRIFEEEKKKDSLVARQPVQSLV